ncbi:MAG: TIGR02300 family protein [Rhodospirillales bacterium]|nr:MAG: TIGR02300 family protein [Rhodospirillales bacterium]
MAKPEWGTKRSCHNCGARFYDLRREPVVCPVCGTVYDPGRQAKTRRPGGRALAPAAVLADEVADTALEDEVAEDEGADVAVESDGKDSADLEDIDSEDSDLIEDASDLGEDDDDIGEVIEHIEDDVEDKP